PEESALTERSTVELLVELAKRAFLWIDSRTHDSIKSRMDNLLVNFASKVDFGQDNVDDQLNFYVDMRQTFPLFSELRSQLIVLVNVLGMKQVQLLRAQQQPQKYKTANSKRYEIQQTTDFIKGCIAFCHVTLPSLEEESTKRAKLALETASLALNATLIGQSEDLLDMSVEALRQIPKTRTVKSDIIDADLEFCEIASQILGLLLVMPGHPHNGPF
ncbi:MAG: hypothetical protein EZS28_045180, partial [Streblomastix strix]